MHFSHSLKTPITIQNMFKQKVHLTMKNHGGSVEHYYHFMLGFLVPLVLWKNTCNDLKSKKIYVRSCGVMDEHINAMGLSELKIIKNKYRHERIRTKPGFNRQLCYIECAGYDDPSLYDSADFSAASSDMFKMLSSDIAKYADEISVKKEPGKPCIVMIDREPPDPFYLSDRCEIRGAGNTKRSINNFEELFALAKAKYQNVLSVTLQGKPLAFQMALFHHADVIIAQHGASLVNLIWCRPNTKVLEIIPSGHREIAENIGYFSRLADCMHLTYARMGQRGEHSDVFPNSFMAYLQRVVDGRPT